MHAVTCGRVKPGSTPVGGVAGKTGVTAGRAVDTAALYGTSGRRSFRGAARRADNRRK
ncbi:hypothetical protein GCM10017781_20230 [Deinococcus metalli]|uniref:Uncharacterized protein n=1 Tax=Deinococcus metalli TaxID=1141878 RepID=A0ABQ3JPX1_9DEIO|nr:hypothetical protein GCM10017781_20230 [Deinococcus metalli]